VAGNLARALIYLRLQSLRNVLVSRLRRLRQPKYMLGAAIGVAYFYFVFGRQFGARPRPRGGAPLQDLAGEPSLVSLLGAAALLVFIALCWVLRRQRAALSFTEAEIAFLFPAPVSRQSLIHYRLIMAMLSSVFTGLILGLVSTRWPGVSPHFAVRFAGWWIVIATLALHTIGSAFVLTRWQDRGISPLRCQLLAIAAWGLGIGLPLAWLWQALQAGTVSGLAAVQEGPVAWLLLPFKLLLGPVLAADAHALVLAVGPALLILGAHYLWVLYAQVGFEEASIAKAEKRAAVLAAMRAGNWRVASGTQKARHPPFDLTRPGRPELAFLWKNLLSAAAYLRLRNALIAAALIVGACAWFADSPLFNGMRGALSSAVLMFAAYTLLLGPQLARQDFRSDLQNTDILKTYPLRGWQIMLGEMLAPATILTVILWLLLLAGALLLPPDLRRMEWLTPAVRTGAALGLALLAPLLCLSQLVITNAAAVLLPAWQPGAGRVQQGVEVMGQRILFVAGQMLVLVLMVLPAGFVAAVGFALSRWIVGEGMAVGIALLLAAGMLAVELGFAIFWLGQRFERLDLSTELRQ
jgi:ABC-2 type transport system permease protein